MTEREVSNCSDCPFVEKEHWRTPDDTGVDMVGCSVSTPPGPWTTWRNDFYGPHPPSWCRLREEPVLVTLKINGDNA